MGTRQMPCGLIGYTAHHAYTTGTDSKSSQQTTNLQILQVVLVQTLSPEFHNSKQIISQLAVS